MRYFVMFYYKKIKAYMSATIDAPNLIFMTSNIWTEVGWLDYWKYRLLYKPPMKD